MKNALLISKSSMSLFFTVMALIVAGILLPGQSSQAQIYEPEGLNMPGAWNSWTNPPSNLALASYTQVVGGRVTKISTGTARWQTIFSVAATGGDLTGGSYEWLFTSGSSSNYYQNKWAGVTITMNTLQLYTKEGSANNSITLVNGKWYTMNFEDLGYVSSRAIFMETSASPVTITSVSVPPSVLAGASATINVVLSGAKSAEENIFLRYSIDNWATSLVVPVAITGNNGTATIPGQVASTVVSYYVFSTTLATVTADYDLVTIKLNNNSGTNYSYTVTAAPPAITWANLQWPESGLIQLGGDFDVYGQAYIAGVTGQPTPAPGLQAWVGYSTTNTDPSTWTNWVPATYSAPAGGNDEFKANIGTVITSAGTYYYATRFKLNSDPYVYGGFSLTGGGFWDGTGNISGTLTVSVTPPPAISWANLQWPEMGSTSPGLNFWVYGQAYIPGLTGQPTPAPGLSAWVGYSTVNTDPSTWTNWVLAEYNAPVGNNDEFKGNIGAQIMTTGTYYYATRFQMNTGAYVYGGYSTTGGGFWDGTINKSGMLDVVTGLPENSSQGNLVFPNPTSGPVTVKVASPSVIQITDAMGRNILRKDVDKGDLQIDLTSFSSGAYHLQIFSGQQLIQQTIIKR